MRVLIADDSAVYRSRIAAALSGASWLEVVGAVNNGRLALERIAKEQVDVLVLDMEMPVLDGLGTLRELRNIQWKTRVIVFSSTTVKGSEATLEALAAGADDFVTKPTGSEASKETPEEAIRRELLPKIQQFMGDFRTAPKVSERVQAPPAPGLRRELSTFRPSAIVIASSTGGPAAHDSVFSGLKGQLRCPVFIAQHMPPVFTETFARRLAACSGLPCKEATNGERVQNAVYVAPGDYHLTLRRDGTGTYTVLDKFPPQNFVRPAADPLFESASEIYGRSLMAFVLTGMGEDGLRGSRAVRAKEGGIMIQDAQSSVVFGMPGALFNAGLYDDIGNLEAIQMTLKRMALR